MIIWLRALEREKDKKKTRSATVQNSEVQHPASRHRKMLKSC
jgi:hypothetical protein